MSASVTFKGTPVKLSGTPVALGSKAPDFSVVANDLSIKTLKDCAGKVVILSAVPSLDTGICDKETRRFNEEAAGLGDGVVIVTVSRDLPFAQKRWCAAAGIDKVMTVSDFRGGSFGRAYGIEMIEGPLAGILARAVFVVGKDGLVKHAQLVPEIAQEPDYAAVLAAARAAL